ncbi:HTH domain-containing protein [Dysgonomonas alginatilytica]|uniref:HTH domain-containing protein n=1 Tax=Dysgonomonas alginatilytica TaxID=1605892 RepID=A0A2V3PM92_9BACT|nr:YafY family protein [Dysgonomonas alginatilytica]PXV63043.1 HTH domain-containing protein [Dysgonomonas alginatilytica]
MQDTSRLSRLTAILILLQSRQIITAKFIADKFGISTRTVYRDIKALEESGVPILTEEGKGYSLMQGYAIPPVMFTETEANALITAEQIVKTNKDQSFVKNYIEAITKIKAVLKHNTKNKAELLSERIQIRNNSEGKTTSDYLSLLQLAITNVQLVHISYTSEVDDTTKRIIEPLALYSTQENWILIAYCRLRKENRAFRLDRIQELEILPENFEPHNFSFQGYFEECKAKHRATLDTGLS